MFSKPSSQNGIFGPKKSVFDPPSTDYDTFVMQKIMQKMGQGSMILSTEEEPQTYVHPSQRKTKFKQPMSDSGAFAQPPADVMNVIKSLPPMKNVMNPGRAQAAQESKNDLSALQQPSFERTQPTVDEYKQKLIKSAKMSPEERRTMDRIRYPMSPLIQQMILQKERERGVMGESRPALVVQEYAKKVDSQPTETLQAHSKTRAQNHKTTVQQLVDIIDESMNTAEHEEQTIESPVKSATPRVSETTGQQDVQSLVALLTQLVQSRESAYEKSESSASANPNPETESSANLVTYSSFDPTPFIQEIQSQTERIIALESLVANQTRSIERMQQTIDEQKSKLLLYQDKWRTDLELFASSLEALSQTFDKQIATLAQPKVTLIATVNAQCVWTKGMYAFATEYAPSSYENFTLDPEWCDEFASAFFPHGHHILVEVPAHEHGDYVWGRTVIVADGSMNPSVCWVLVKYKGSMLVDNLMTTADWVNSLSLAHDETDSYTGSLYTIVDEREGDEHRYHPKTA